MILGRLLLAYRTVTAQIRNLIAAYGYAVASDVTNEIALAIASIDAQSESEVDDAISAAITTALANYSTTANILTDITNAVATRLTGPQVDARISTHRSDQEAHWTRTGIRDALDALFGNSLWRTRLGTNRERRKSSCYQWDTSSIAWHTA